MTILGCVLPFHDFQEIIILHIYTHLGHEIWNSFLSVGLHVVIIVFFVSDFLPVPLFQVTDYLYDAPLLLQLLARGLGTMGGLVWLFLFRVALCCIGTVVSISSPPLGPVSSSSSPLETDPSLCGLLGVLDDLVVVILLLTCVINISQQMAQETGLSANAAAAQGVIGNSL